MATQSRHSLPCIMLEETNDAQGGISYKMYDNPRNPSYGLPPRRLKKEQKLVDAMHNKGSYPGFDEQNQYVGVFTPLDALHNVENTTAIALEEPSDNAMDTNWEAQTLVVVKLQTANMVKN